MSRTDARWSRVSRTALGVARVRAQESARTDALFHDPYAPAFLAAAADERSEVTPPTPLSTALAFHIVIRTRFYDDFLLDASARGCRQVVVLAAGLDSRAFRLAWPADTSLYELDLPDVIGYKDAVLHGQAAMPRCRRTTLGVDLRDDWAAALYAAGFDPGMPTAWLAEGLLVYLDAGEAAALLDVVTRLSAPGSRLAFERGSAAEAVRRATGGVDPHSVVALWRGGLGDDAGDRLTERGWEVAFSALAEVAAAYGRPVATPSASGFIAAGYLA